MSELVETRSSVQTNIILPLVGSALLLPNAAVAEVVLAGQLTSAVSSPFLLGYMIWREQEIPVISFEGLLEGELPAGVTLRQMAVLNGITDRQKMPFFCVALSGVPRLARLRDSDITPLDTETNPLIHSYVRALDTKLMIPDWDMLEQEIIEAL
jgi:chemosensory pili system protein ChpC